MNIFVLDSDPIVAARAQCDKHVVKMVLESAQLLCSAALVLDPSLPRAGLYRPTHVNHPAGVWLRSSRGSADWFATHALELALEYERRYGRPHSSLGVLRAASSLLLPRVPRGSRSPFVFCGPVEYSQAAASLGETGDDAIVCAYRLYYMGDKRRFARWRFPCSPAPAWWI